MSLIIIKPLDSITIIEVQLLVHEQRPDKSPLETGYTAAQGVRVTVVQCN